MREHLVPLDADHRSLCNIDVRDPGFDELCKQINVGLEEARDRIASGSPDSESKYTCPIRSDDI